MTIQDQLKQHIEKKRMTHAEVGAMFKPVLSRQHVFRLLNNDKSVSAKTMELIDKLGFELTLKAKQ